MTVITGIKVDTIYRLNEVKSAIENNDFSWSNYYLC